MALQVHCGSARPRTPGSFSLVSEGDADFPGVDHSLLSARRGYNSRHPETSPGQGGRHSQTAATRNGNPSRFLAVLRPTRPFRARTTRWSRGGADMVPLPRANAPCAPPRPQRPPRWPHECPSTVLLPRPAPRGAEGPPGPGGARPLGGAGSCLAGAEVLLVFVWLVGSDFPTSRAPHLSPVAVCLPRSEVISQALFADPTPQPEGLAAPGRRLVCSWDLRFGASEHVFLGTFPRGTFGGRN